MADPAHLSTADKIGTGVAIVMHAALGGLLWWMAKEPQEPPPPPQQRIDVSLATEISLESTAPNPDAQPAASLAPVVTEVPEPPSEPVSAPPEPVTAPPEPPRARPETPPRVTPTGRATPRPTPSASAAPRPSPSASGRPAPRPSATPSATPSRRAGGSRLGENFLEGSGSNTTSSDRGQPAATFGAAERASLVSAIARQLRPNWSAPRGQDWELLVSRVSWSLNRDGTVRGTPRCSQVGRVTDSNRPQVDVHCEAAIRAVRTTRFNLPEQFYTHWDDLEFDFDRRL